MGRLTPIRRLYPLRIPRTSALPAASSRFPVARDTLAVRLTFPLTGHVEDFHLRVSAPCRAHPTETDPPRVAPNRSPERPVPPPSLKILANGCRAQSRRSQAPVPSPPPRLFARRSAAAYRAAQTDPPPSPHSPRVRARESPSDEASSETRASRAAGPPRPDR